MTIPNKLTTIRVILVPFFVALLLLGDRIFGSASDFIACGIFVLASITDFFDGMLARKLNQVTNYGKFMDPLADKLLVCSAFVCLATMGRGVYAWEVVIIICREFVVSGLRLIAVEEGKVIAASIWGKAKTFVSMIAIIVVILHLQVNIGESFAWWYVFEQILMYASVILTVLSMVDYLWKNRNILKSEMGL